MRRIKPLFVGLFAVIAFFAIALLTRRFGDNGAQVPFIDLNPKPMTLQQGMRADAVMLPTEDNQFYHWVYPVPDPEFYQNCGNCHQDIYAEWRAGAHAR